MQTMQNFQEWQLCVYSVLPVEILFRDRPELVQKQSVDELKSNKHYRPKPDGEELQDNAYFETLKFPDTQ